MAARKRSPVENEPDFVTGEVVDDGVSATEAARNTIVGLAPVAPPQEIARYHGIATLAMTPEQIAIIRAPINPNEIEFRWGDAAKTYALAYAPQVQTRKRLCDAFNPGGWAFLPYKSFIADEEGRSFVCVEGGLYIYGKFVAHSMGRGVYREANRNTYYDDAWESAKSDCIGRCVKDIGMWEELRDKSFTGPLERAWIKASKKKCPQCGRDDYFQPDKTDPTRWFCWKNLSKGKDGCGWEGIPPEDGETVQSESRTGGTSPAPGGAQRRPSPSGTQSRTPAGVPSTTAAGGGPGYDEWRDIGNRIQDTLKAREAGESLADIAGKQESQSREQAAAATARVGFESAMARLVNVTMYAESIGLFCATQLRRDLNATIAWAENPRTPEKLRDNAEKIDRMIERVTAEYKNLRDADLPF